MGNARDRREGRVSARRRVDTHKTGFTSTTYTVPEGVSFFNLDSDKPRLIEIIPFTAGNGNPFADKGMLHFERTFFQHRNIGVNEDSYICPAKTCGKRCPICEERARLAREPDTDKDLLDSLAPKERQLFLVLDHDDWDKGLKLWDISFHLFGKRLDKEVKRGSEEDQFFADPEIGKTLRIAAEEKSFGGNAFYEVDSVRFEARTKKIPQKIFDDAPCLDDILIVLPYDELKKIFLQIDDGENDKDDDGEKETEKEHAPPKKKEETPPPADPPKEKPQEKKESSAPTAAASSPSKEKPTSATSEATGSSAATTASPSELVVGAYVTHSKLGRLEVLKVSADGKSFTGEDMDGEIHRNIALKDVTVKSGGAKAPAASEKPKEAPKESSKPKAEEEDWDANWDTK